MPADTRTIAELSHDLRSSRLRARDIVEQCLERIAARNASINAFITVRADEARHEADDADREIAAGRWRGPLHGIPVSLKDIIDQRGVPTTAASRVRGGHVAANDATVVARLRHAGAVLIGKTNLHEFAFGTTNEDSAYGAVQHPLDASRSPGGSSGGSAASVLDGMACASVGTDTGGSIRIPAAACGLVGLKPGLGEVPTDGVVPLSATMDHIGPICRSVADAGFVYGALRGQANPAPIAPAVVRGMRLGIPRAYFLSLLDDEVAAGFERACTRLAQAGVIFDDVAVPHAREIAPVYLHLVLPEAAAYHAHTLEERSGDYTPNVRIRLEMGRYILAEDYVRAMQGRAVLTAEVEAALHGRDGLLLPSLAVPATTLGEPTVRIGGADEPVRNITLRLTQLFNITGHPAIAVPCGATRAGLPISLQLVGHQHRTVDLLAAASALEPYAGSGASM
jgi:aspartyl-tRNA(Asn)/glutamyl-tRNA(Gln) amidotransferase subunit A